MGIVETAYTLLFIGVLFDDASTVIALHMGFQELNPWVVSLMERGLWPIFDFALLIVVALATEYLDGLVERRLGRRALIALPATLGLLRLLMGLHNTALLVSVFLT
mgnify:CR=1 FL=1